MHRLGQFRDSACKVGGILTISSALDDAEVGATGWQGQLVAAEDFVDPTQALAAYVSLRLSAQLPLTVVGPPSH